ncbi:GNAT family N-acetyltransferase [Streptomyces sp. CBMA29]|uniref:GNAT family N-acetyltransferase n=1 Tax=Streptomyces sp. CBMA29 TaxID=1896314 RepID=UPI001CB6E80B|nr:GNAT family N-acetyltransferase [Streptomyces sp. CBMA29]MBD0738246.1 hypothetical protein [Streptomyces sp. CBMA29]
MRYRTATAADEPGLHALWAVAFPDPAQVIALWQRDPGRHGRTFVAEDDGGRPVSVVHYLPRPIRSAEGRPQRVGCLGSVATHPDARGRGHVRHLLAAAVRAMTADACAWSLLFTGTPQVYESAGWRTFAAPGWSGPLAAPPSTGLPPSVRPATRADLPALRALRDGFDAVRPLSTVRGADDWLHRIPVWYAAPTEILVAHEPGPAGRPVGFAVLRRPAPDRAELAEIALAADHAAAADSLLATAAVRARAAGATTATVRLPPEAAVLAALPRFLAEPVPVVSHYGMARPILSPAADVTATVTAPGAVHWYGDSF